jgi:hypothetical protein
MTDPTSLTKEEPTIPVTLDDLKRVIAAVGRRPFTDGDFFSTARLCDWQSRRADAWKVAFFWFHHHMQRPDEGKEKDAEYFAEYDEGFKLIAEKLP